MVNMDSERTNHGDKYEEGWTTERADKDIHCSSLPRQQSRITQDCWFYGRVADHHRSAAALRIEVITIPTGSS